MAHLRLQHDSSQPSIFSPSVARAAASTAKDWAYVDAWLKQKYSAAGTTSRIPSFERNADTLRILLALVAANEAADEERDQLARFQDAALHQVRAVTAAKDDARRRLELAHADIGKNNNDDDNGISGGPAEGSLVVEDLLCAIEDNLTKESRTALDSMTGMAVELGVPVVNTNDEVNSSNTLDAYDASASNAGIITPALLASRFIELQASAVEVERAAARVEILHEFVRRESARLAGIVDSLVAGQQREQEASAASGGHGLLHDSGNEDTAHNDNVYQPDPDMARQNQDLQRRIKTMHAQLPDLEQKVAALRKMSQMPTITVEDVKEDEDEYLRVLARKKELDAQVKAFAGLPPDVEAARVELEALREELRSMTDRRDNNFERLVERESPAKPIRRR